MGGELEKVRVGAEGKLEASWMGQYHDSDGDIGSS